MQKTQETWVRSLGWEGPLEEGMATHSSILAWEIPWTEEPGGLQSMQLQRVGHDWIGWAHTHIDQQTSQKPLPCGALDSGGRKQIRNLRNEKIVEDVRRSISAVGKTRAREKCQPLGQRGLGIALKIECQGNTTVCCFIGGSYCLAAPELTSQLFLNMWRQLKPVLVCPWPSPPSSALDPLLLAVVTEEGRGEAGTAHRPPVSTVTGSWDSSRQVTKPPPLRGGSWVLALSSNWHAALSSHREAVDWRCLWPAWYLGFEPSYQKLI